jgi:hypothetical protein
MTVAAWMEQTFSQAAGWLGWEPDVILDTPLPLLSLAFAGKADFLRKTNPWRTKEDVEADRIAEQSGSPSAMVNTFRSLALGAKKLPKRKKSDGG